MLDCNGFRSFVVIFYVVEIPRNDGFQIEIFKRQIVFDKRFGEQCAHCFCKFDGIYIPALDLISQFQKCRRETDESCRHTCALFGAVCACRLITFRRPNAVAGCAKRVRCAEVGGRIQFVFILIHHRHNAGICRGIEQIVCVLVGFFVVAGSRHDNGIATCVFNSGCERTLFRVREFFVLF